MIYRWNDSLQPPRAELDPNPPAWQGEGALPDGYSDVGIDVHGFGGRRLDWGLALTIGYETKPKDGDYREMCVVVYDDATAPTVILCRGHYELAKVLASLQPLVEIGLRSALAERIGPVLEWILRVPKDHPNSKDMLFDAIWEGEWPSEYKSRMSRLATRKDIMAKRGKP